MPASECPCSFGPGKADSRDLEGLFRVPWSLIIREAITTSAVVPFPVWTIWVLPTFLQLGREDSTSHLPHRVGRWQQAACQRRGCWEKLGDVSQIPRAEARATPFPGSTAPLDNCLNGRTRVGLGFVAPFQNHGPDRKQLLECKFCGVKIREYWPPIDVAGGLDLETQSKEARDVLGLTV